MTHERLFLIWHSIALLALFTAVGSGPAVGLIRDRRLRIATMPILGFALTASVLVTASHFLPIETATWTLLLPGAALSLGIALFLRRKLPATGRAGELAIPGAALVVGIALALAPPLQQGAQGPFALMIDDAWSYSASSLFLQHHRTDARLPASVGATDLETAYGAGAVSNDARIGVDSTDAASATIFHADTGSTLSPLLAVLFGFIPLGIWLVVRGLGGSWPAAALGAALGLTPAILSMVEDTALGNLAGEALAAPALFFVVSSLRAERSSRLDAVVAGVLLGGMAAVFPEFLIPAAIIIACICLALGIGQVRQRAIREWALLFGGRVGLAAVTAIVVAPNAVPRAFHYLFSHAVNSGFSNTLPSRDLTVENMGAWAFGLHHLYELPSISSLPPSHRVFYVYFPVVLAAIVLVGVVRLRRSGLLVLVPILVAPAIGLYTFHLKSQQICVLLP